MLRGGYICAGLDSRAARGTKGGGEEIIESITPKPARARFQGWADPMAGIYGPSSTTRTSFRGAICV